MHVSRIPEVVLLLFNRLPFLFPKCLKNFFRFHIFTDLWNSCKSASTLYILPLSHHHILFRKSVLWGFYLFQSCRGGGLFFSFVCRLLLAQALIMNNWFLLHEPNECLPNVSNMSVQRYSIKLLINFSNLFS
jgi:hypothetical protein